MKKIVLTLLVTLIFYSSQAGAKFNPPDGYVDRATRSAVMEFYKLDKNKDGKLSPEEYDGKKKLKVTREVEKARRRARKNGTFMTPEEQFKAMDEEDEGFITLDQFIRFYTGMEKSDGGKGKYY